MGLKRTWFAFICLLTLKLRLNSRIPLTCVNSTWTQSWGVLSLGPANYWLITSSDTGHSRSQCQIWALAHLCWQKLNPSQTLSCLTSSEEFELSCVGVGATGWWWWRGGGFCVSETVLFTLFNILKWFLHTDDSSVKPENEKWSVSPYLYTNMHGSAADFQCLHFYHPIRADVWSYCYTKWFLHLLHIKHWSERKGCHRVYHLTNL